VPVRDEAPGVFAGDGSEASPPFEPHAVMLRRRTSADVLLAADDGCQTRWMLTVVKPSPVRLWGFLLTVVGGAAIAFGSIGNWAAVSLGGSTENAVPTKGVDLWQGKVALVLGASIVIAILALRMVRPERRNVLAGGITLFAIAAAGIAVWCLVALDSLVHDTGVDQAIAAFGRQAVTDRGIHLEQQSSVLVVLAGGVVATAGGLVDLMWVRMKRDAGDAIDPDTAPATASEPDPGPDG
jgi:hypothetical protein